MSDFDDWSSDEDIPWASPEIQQNYEVALGRFMLGFNRLDNRLSGAIKAVLERLGRADWMNACRKISALG